MDCPREIRDQIHGKIFGEHQCYNQASVIARPHETPKSSSQPFCSDRFNILVLSRQISDEAMRVLYEEKFFRYYASNRPLEEEDNFD